MPVTIRIMFVNDTGISGPPYPVETESLPKIGEVMTAPLGDNIPEATVLHVCLSDPPDHLKFATDLMYGPDGYDGLPLVICKVPDGWTPFDISSPPVIH